MTTIDQRVRSVAYDADGLQIDGVTVPLVSGSMEYWRLISLKWRTCLQAMKGAGLDFVSSFVCWDFHELEDGTFDFTGVTHPSRDLAGFLDMCAEEGFDVLLRTGPIIDAEWPTRGPAPDVCQMERIDPRYRARCEEYLAALYEHVVPRLATNGGPVVMVAVENEAYFPYATDEESDPSEGSIPIPYQRDVVLDRYSGWLRERYGDDASLRSAWSDPGASIASPREPDYANDGSRAVLDSYEFITDTIAETYQWMRDFSRRRGVDVPIYSNMKPLSQYIGWRQVEEVVDGHGIGLFMSNMVPGEQALVTSWYVRLARALTRFPFAAEFQSLAPMGQEEVFGVLSDEHQRYITELALSLGLRGIAYYVFVERDDAQGAPISPLGKVRPRLEQVKRAIEMAKAVGPDEQLRSVGLLWSYDHHRMSISQRFPGWDKLYHCWIGMNSPQELPAWWDAFRALHDGDLDFAITPMEDAEPTGVLLYAGPDEVRLSEWQRVADAVEDGATLATAALPTRDIDGDHDAVGELSRRIAATGRLVERDAPALELLGAAGAEPVVSAGTPGVWTSAYEGDDAFFVFVANTGSEPVGVHLALGGPLAAARATDLVEGVDVTLGEDELELPAKRVRAFTIPKTEA